MLYLPRSIKPKAPESFDFEAFGSLTRRAEVMQAHRLIWILPQPQTRTHLPQSVWFGLPPESLDVAIRGWGPPVERGTAERHTTPEHGRMCVDELPLGKAEGAQQDALCMRYRHRTGPRSTVERAISSATLNAGAASRLLTGTNT